MSYRLKTLIVFDTNSLRSTDGGKVAYSFFAFGRPFQIIEEFVLENKLFDDIHIAIPTWAIEELKDQKHRQYKQDIVEFEKLAKRLSGLPHIGEITLPETEFDCATYIDEKAIEFLAAKNIKLLDIKEDIADRVLRSLMTRVLRDERQKAPFVHAKKGSKTYKDAGFKDNLIWESLLHFDEVPTYDKIILVTNDGDFSEFSSAEFKLKWNKHISVFSSETLAIAEIQKDYGNYIKNRKVYEYAQTEYFDDYLKDLLSPASIIQFRGEELKIENYRIISHCEKVEMVQDDEGDFTSPIVYSSIVVFSTLKDEKVEISVVAKTKLSDSEFLELQETTFDPEIYNAN